MNFTEQSSPEFHVQLFEHDMEAERGAFIFHGRIDRAGIVLRLREARVEFDGAAQSFDRCLVLLRIALHDAEIVERGDVRRTQPDGFEQGFESFLVASELHVGRAEIVMRFGELRLEADGESCL